MKYVAAAIARVFRVPPTTICFRMHKYNISAVQAAQMPHRRRDSLSVKARELGLRPSTVLSRIRKKGLSIEEALTRPLSPRGPNTITKRALAAGLPPSTVHRRMLYCGMSLDDAIAGGKDMRVRVNGKFVRNPAIAPETRTKATRKWRDERRGLTSKRVGATELISPRSE